MASCRLIHTFPEFQAYWQLAQDQPLGAQIEAWASEYISAWPELLDKQLDDCCAQEIRWREIAR
jgi:hypothetical protein